MKFNIRFAHLVEQCFDLGKTRKAVIPPLQGYISDAVGIHFSYIIPLLGFCYLAFFAIKVKNILIAKGLDFDKVSAGH